MGRYLCMAVISAALSLPAYGAYKPVTPRDPKAGEIAVTQPGNYAKAGTTYVLTQDVRAPRSAIFLGKDVVLDLNGHTLTYADGYENVPNFSFEDGLKGWDTSKAPTAKVNNTRWTQHLVGDHTCTLPQGEEIVSPYIRLPEADRAYYAMVAVAQQGMHVGIYVEDEKGKSVECVYMWGNNRRPCCPEKRRGPKLGGGTVFALLFGQPAGKYRIRVRAVNRNCVIDAVDIRPAMDVGIGIVDKTLPWAYYKCILDGDGCAFFDYTQKGSTDTPVDSIPRVQGTGTITIKNGVIKNGCRGIRSWGIQSTARGVRLVLENIQFEASGINTQALYSNGPVTLKDCRTEIDTPWIIDRHRQQAYSVWIGGQAPSEIADCEFVGGQGQVSVSGDNSKIHDNLFVNKQTVVNHYSLGPGGQGTQVFRNRFLPEQGSGILIFRRQGLQIYENEFKITASPPVNEYHHTDYSVSAIRLTDYNAKKGSTRGYCGENYIHHNKITITGRLYPEAKKSYKPMVYGIFMSVGGDQNYVHDNEITVHQLDPPNNDRHGAYAFYIGGSNNGGTYYRNTITTNVTPIWISNMYGQARNVTMYDNTFIKASGAKSFVPFKLGWYKNPSENVRFFSNVYKGLEFGVHIYDYTTKYISAFDRGWTLTVKTQPAAEVVILDKAGQEILKQKADRQGLLRARLAQYRAQGQGQVVENGKRRVKIGRTDVSHYTVKASGQEATVVMDKDKEISLAL